MLDLSRRLRMDEREPKTPHRGPSGHDPSGRTGADAAPVAVDDPVVAPNANQAEAHRSRRESTYLVFCDNEQEVMKGFAIALRAMGLG
jgi:hypothetical protein